MVDYRNPYRNVDDSDEVITAGALEAQANDRQVGGSHYKEGAMRCPHCSGMLEHWDLAWAGQWDMFQYNVTKYLLRWRRKAGLNDLRKAQHHLQKYIEVLEKETLGEATPPKSSPEGY